MPALAVWTPEDGLLGALAPLGLAAAAPAGSTLVIDLDEAGPRYPGKASLAGLVEESPRLSDLRPGRPGVAVLRNGGIGATAASEVVEALIQGWDRTVLRLPPRRRVVVPVPVVPVRLLIPGRLFAPLDGPVVLQSTPSFARVAGVGIRLPVPARSTVAALLRGESPVPGDRWVKAWRRVWEAPWDR
ncbi:MAG: hypothetical protein KJ698_07060 [Actinobacteria bacterium]|nr:hypothetical protein [Actinomycetota bacterium]MBU1865711.1 hypothetical protein [Actinomycetota bacterium]